MKTTFKFAFETNDICEVELNEREQETTLLIKDNARRRTAVLVMTSEEVRELAETLIVYAAMAEIKDEITYPKTKM